MARRAVNSRGCWMLTASSAPSAATSATSGPRKSPPPACAGPPRSILPRSRRSRDVPVDHVAGYVLVNDISEREFQMERGGTWDKGKGCDTFGPVGPWLVTRDEIGDVQNLGLWLDLNGKRMQTGNTRTMIFGVATLVSYVSRFITLEPADIITTGTPPGVGLGQKPQPFYLKPGDTMRLGIEKLGEQRQKIVAWRPPDRH